MATLCPVRMCSATLTCRQWREQERRRLAGHNGGGTLQGGSPWRAPPAGPRAAHLAERSDAQRLAQPVVLQEELGAGGGEALCPWLPGVASGRGGIPR